MFAAVSEFARLSLAGGTKPEVAYRLPGFVVVSIAGCLSQAYDGLVTAALAAQHDNRDALAVSLEYARTRMDAIYESILAVVGEQEEGKHGSQRPC